MEAEFHFVLFDRQEKRQEDAVKRQDTHRSQGQVNNATLQIKQINATWTTRLRLVKGDNYKVSTKGDRNILLYYYY